ncbi:MAG: hypothetical protein WAW73_08455 [Rhodoferax sp.]
MHIHTTPAPTPSRSLVVLRLGALLLAATTAFSAAGQDNNSINATLKDQIARIRTLYACSHFAKEVASVQENEERRANLQKRVTAYTAKAAARATALDSPQDDPNTRLVDALSELGKSDFAAFMHKAMAIADTTERNGKLNAFAARCDREAAAQ